MADFKTIAGHERIISHLQESIAANKVSHAYIFNGENGSGKLLLANVFAKALQCEKGGMDACGTCKSCLQSASGNHPDIKYITHEKITIGVDDIREQINQDIDVKPYSGRYKIYIMQDANRLTEQAQNALLKTIEEPPEYAIIILLTENSSSLLTTILSRCVTLNLRAVPKNVVKEYLITNRGIPENLAESSAAFCQGNIGRAIRYAASEDFDEMRADVLRLLKYIDEMDISDIMGIIKHFGDKKAQINDYVDLMTLWYRDILMFKVTRDANLLLYRDEVQYISAQASIRSYEQIENIIRAMDKAKTRLAANVNFDTTLELMLLTIKEK